MWSVFEREYALTFIFYIAFFFIRLVSFKLWILENLWFFVYKFQPFMQFSDFFKHTKLLFSTIMMKVTEFYSLVQTFHNCEFTSQHHIELKFVIPKHWKLITLTFPKKLTKFKLSLTCAIKNIIILKML